MEEGKMFLTLLHFYMFSTVLVKVGHQLVYLLTSNKLMYSCFNNQDSVAEVESGNYRELYT